MCLPAVTEGMPRVALGDKGVPVKRDSLTRHLREGVPEMYQRQGKAWEGLQQSCGETGKSPRLVAWPSYKQAGKAKINVA